MARLLILFAALGLTTAAPQLVFNADDGKRTAITFDGTTLNVPQHCRSDTCNTFDARMNAMDERFNTMSLRIDGVVQSVADLAKTLADHKAIASTDEERINAINTISLTPGPKGEKGDKGDKGDKGEKGDAGVRAPVVSCVQGYSPHWGTEHLRRGDRGVGGLAWAVWVAGHSCYPTCATESSCRQLCADRNAPVYNWQMNGHGCRCYTKQQRAAFTPEGDGWKMCTVE